MKSISAVELLHLSCLLLPISSAEILLSSDRSYSVADLLRNGAVVEPNDQLRQLENEDGGAYQYAFDDDVLNEHLINYSAKFLKCIPDRKIKNEYGATTYGGAVLFRLCPTNKCSRKKSTGCNSGYADFAVSLQTFVKIFMNDQQNTVFLDDDAYDAERLGQCGAYNGHVGGGEDEDDEDEERSDSGEYGELYLGPSCTRDGKGIKLDFYNDYNCTEPSEYSLRDIENGWSSPFNNTSLVGGSCFSCSSDNNANSGVRDMCTNLYESAAYRCEDKWDFEHFFYDPVTEIHRYGQDTVGCKYINGYTKKPTNDVGDVISLVALIALSIAAWVVYSSWWKKSK